MKRVIFLVTALLLTASLFVAAKRQEATAGGGYI
jgi:uncharacterized protein YycO